VTNVVKLLSVATTVPRHSLMQADAETFAEEVFATRLAEFERLRPIFKNTGIRKRHIVRPMDWYRQPLDWASRTSAYLEAADDLFISAASLALEKAGLRASEVDTVVTVSSTGIATPSLEARAMERMGFRPTITRVPIFGLGCGGGAGGLSIAAKLAAAQPGKIILLVVIEICSLAFRLDLATNAHIVATALFGDGAAACVLKAGAGAGLAAVTPLGDYTWPDTTNLMGWTVDPAGFGVVFAQRIPSFVEQKLATALAEFSLFTVDRYLCHPGGSKVVNALETALNLPEGTLDLEREVLSDNGNMSAPTVLFVLEKAIEKQLPARSALLAMGPGFSASCVGLTQC
jgi:alkylresorcinol/alkylpyrone synthase